MKDRMNIREALAYTTTMLNNVSNPALEARILLQHILNVQLEYLFSHNDYILSSLELSLLMQVINRRQKLEPIAYILQYKEFYGRDFFVTNDVLIPRPDSETLIECILKDYKNHSDELSILDIGTGSGCLIITLLLELQNAIGTAIDIDSNALKIAHKNTKQYNLENKIEFIESNWFSNLQTNKKFDIIISNPPYITSTTHMAEETVLYEPKIALFDDRNKHDRGSYNIIAEHARSFLKPDGRMYLEIGYDQAQEISTIYIDSGYNIQDKIRDIAGHIRCLKISQ